MKPRTQWIDPGLKAIADLERVIVTARLETLAFHNTGPEEIARERAAAVALARTACDQLRAEHRARTSPSS